MSLTAAAELARCLTRLSVDLRRRPDGADLSDLLAEAAGLERDVHAVGVPDLACVWQLRMGEILFKAGRFADAAARADASATALGALREADLQVAALELKARCLDRLGDWEGLDEVAQRGIAIVERYRYSLSAPYLKSAYMRARIALYALGVRAALRRGDHVALVRRAELSKCRALAAPRRLECQTPEAERLERRLRDVTERINRAEEAGQSPMQLLVERRTLWDLFEAARRGERLDAEPDLECIQAALNPGEAVLYYYWIDRTSLLRVVLDREALAVDPLEVTAEQRTALNAFAAELTSADDRIEKHVVDRIDEFRDLLWPVDATAQRLLASAQRLIVSPHLQLHALPIGALSVEGTYIICRWALRFAPNLTTLLAGRDEPRLEKRLLAVGVGRYDIPGARLADLPSAPTECEDVGRIYAAAGWRLTRLIDAEATETALEAASKERPAVMHFACHGKSVEADTPLESRLYLARSVLDGLEIALMRLAPTTVVLSACCAGQRAIRGRTMNELPGDDLLGLQSAFFASGASEIVAALFPVDDRAARTICVAFHRERAAGHPADVALASAIRGFIEKAGALTRRRYYWAPFFLSAVGPNAASAPGKETEEGSVS